MTTPAHDIEAVKKKTNRAQADAADPQASVWVNANAGTGKTHVLTLRVLRILLSGTPPERILCLTYTKAAAAEMSKRIFDQLGSWVTATNAALQPRLRDITGTEASEKDLDFARTLFTAAIETPGGLKIQTIHAFAERLLQRFPLEAGVPPGFKILDDEKGRELKARAIEQTLLEATSSPSSTLGKALTSIIRYAADSNFDELLSKTIAERAWLEAASRFDLGAKSADFAGAESYLRTTFGVRKTATLASIEKERAALLSDAELRDLRDHLAGGGKTDMAHSVTLAEALSQASAAQRGATLSEYFLTGNGDGKRASLMSKKLGEDRGDLLSLAQKAQDRCFDLTAEFKALALVDANAALYRLAGAVLQRYTDAKASSGALDFDDLIQKTTSLLNTSDQAQWVLFKLDGGLDHILVDEAQDTSPAQWQIVEALSREFFSGSSARDVKRTVFAVGDEKQSIYSFQGAAPEQFAEVGKRVEALTLQAATPWRRVPLNLSFRTVQPVLDAVDGVFSNAETTPGLTAEASHIKHIASRFGQSGLIEIWPTEKSIEAEQSSPWTPLDDNAARAPANQLADRIAGTIEGWLKNKEKLVSEDRPIRAGDVLILVRKRNPFAVPMVSALKARGIPVAGSDRIALTDQIAVQDLLALGDFLTLPEDDLALATVLKGPLFDFDDDDLLTLAHGRKATLWKAFLAASDTMPKFKAAADTLKRWRSKADFTPPFEFFSALLDREGARSKMLHRLGPESADAVDEFLDVALAYDDNEPPSLTGFLANLRNASREIKRDMDHARDEVRVMTVHGAKGLEAPIVFLSDTCTTVSGDIAGTRLLKMPDVARPTATPPPVIWQVKGTSKLAAVRAATLSKEAREREERNRLLYVAMTRARDRLYVSGFEGKNGRTSGCWYDLIFNGLSETCVKTGSGGDMVWRIETSQSEAPEKPKLAHSGAVQAQKLPPFAERRAAAEPQLSMPLAPSRLEPYAPDNEGEPLVLTRAPNDPSSEPGLPSPPALASGNRFLRGTITHALLQYLPEIAEGERKAAATGLVTARGAALTSKARISIVKETLAILNSSDFAAIFSSDSRAEVPISAVLPRPSGKGLALSLSGQIDRLLVTEEEVMIIDYKTNRPPPVELLSVAPAYLYQLAAYALALADIYPGKRLRAALLWTDGPRLMEIPANVLREYGERLWKLDPASLNGTTLDVSGGDTYVPAPNQ
jgi:ATP-dependent helicase/nuclease subunit A